MKLIGIDTETGGISRYTSLLTAAFIIYDHKFNELDSLELLIKPEDEEYIVTAEGLEVNGINLIEHNKKAKTKKQLKTELYEFIKKHSQNGSNKLIPFGWNVEFDIKRIANDEYKECILSKGSWLKNVSYRCIDGAGLFMSEKLKGNVPLDQSGGLSNVIKYYNLEFPGEAHTALADVRASALVIKKILGL